MKKKPVLAIFLALFIDFIAFGLIIPVVPALFSAEDHTIFDPSVSAQHRTFLYGMLMGVFALSTFLGAPLLGTLSDRWGRKKIMIITNTANALGFFVFGLGIIEQNFWFLFIGRTLPGLFGGSIFIVQSAMADVSTEENKTKNFGLVGVACGLGFIFGALLGGILGDPTININFGPTLPVFVAMGFNLVNVVFILFFLSETVSEFANTPIHALSGFENLGIAFTDRKMRTIYSVIFILTLGFSFFIQFLPIYLVKKFSFTQMGVGFMFAAIGVYAAISQGLILRLFTRRFLPDQILLFLTPLFAVTYLLLLLPETPGWLYLIMPIMIIFQGITFPNTLTIISNNADRKSQGRYIGINQSLNSFASALSAFAASSLASLHDSYIMTFGAACTAVAYLFFLSYYRNKQSMRKEALQQALVEPVNSAEDMEALKEMLAKAGLPFDDVGEQNQRFFLYRFKELVLGTIGLQKAGNFGLLRSLSVAREFRRKHLGQNMIDKLINYSSETGIQQLYLITTSAQTYFEKQGFREISREKVPSEIQGTREYAELCPSEAKVMVKYLAHE
ncbi:MAG: MFS transporter [Bacteroidia bacterium]|nr:MFS transporter [Bacteroidia bacterium]